MSTEKKKSKYYFTEKTEQAIIDYNLSEDDSEKNRIFNEHIEYPFSKIAENIINKYKFTYLQQDNHNLKNDVVSFMISKIHKYREKKGRAFSYFSVMARNYLVAGNREVYNKLTIHHSIDNDFDDFELSDEEQESRTISDMSEFFELFMEYWENNLNVVFTKKDDIKIADAILELFRRSHNIENFNKKSLYILIREMTGVKTQYITGVINKMKDILIELLREFNNTGYFDTSPQVNFPKTNKKQ